MINIDKLKIFSLFILALALSPFSTAIAQQPGDIMAPNTAQPMWIAGVNWGAVTESGSSLVTDRSISITGARIIPLPPDGVKTFRVEYGRGVPGQNTDYGQGYIGQSNPITVDDMMNPAYSFGGNINSLMPATDYYLNIREMGQVGGNDVTGNLFVYGFVKTSKIPSGSVSYSFISNNTTMKVSGHLINSAGVALMNASVNIIVAPVVNGAPDMNGAMTSGLITGGTSMMNGNGYFNTTMTGPVTPGSSYYLMIQYQSTGNDIIEPILLTVPTYNAQDTDPEPNPDTDNEYELEGPSYNGLVVECGLDCDFYDLIATINRVIDFMIKFIAFPLVAIVVAWAGFKMIISGGSSEAVGSAKKMIWKVVIGLCIALLCWVIIKLILVTLGYVPGGPLWCLFNITPQCTP